MKLQLLLILALALLIVACGSEPVEKPAPEATPEPPAPEVPAETVDEETFDDIDDLAAELDALDAELDFSDLDALDEELDFS